MHCILQATAVYSYTTSAASHYVTTEKRRGIKCGGVLRSRILVVQMNFSHTEENVPTVYRKNGHPRRVGPFTN